MAKFCKYCGRRLEEGAVCVCRQQPVEDAAAPVNTGAAAETQATAASDAASAQAEQVAAPSAAAETQQAAGASVAGNEQAQQSAGASAASYDQAQQGAGAADASRAQAQAQRAADPAPGGAQSGGPGINTEWINKQKQVFVSGTKSALGEILPILRQPVSRVHEVSLSGNGRLGKELIIGKAVIFMVVAMVALMILSGRIEEMGYGLVEVEMPYLQVLLGVLVLTAGMDFVEAFLLKAISGAFGGVTTNSAMMNVIGARGIYDTLIMLVCAIVGFMAVEMAYLVCVLLIALSSIMELAIYQGTVVQMDENKKPYAFFLAKLCMMIILAIVAYLLVRSAMDSVVGSVMEYMM